ncbi:hypothetical protein KFL_001300310 [Klebsormidium nitens]|uniref:FAS1 domain-containing protein n=1 Tax=Klebsormidium nitens TaxID=105231 RepID=A0A1Y1I2J1_KLENI|nr:hypothetical protein KFL_001300310 [Klebsormidium nitens]|eukprot:GAQ82967.1 hypothetical protein KFL_001300310 [Klebsormidium nitens]
MAAWAVSLAFLLLAAGVNGQTVVGQGEECRSGGNILPITCASGLTCVPSSTSLPILPDIASLGTCQVTPTNATLTAYQAIKAENDKLVAALTGGNFLAVANFVTPDVQLVLPNLTSPLTLSNINTLLLFSGRLSPLPGSTGLPEPVDRLFISIDANNSITVQILAAGQLGNVYITALWRLLSDGWTVSFADITPADTAPIVNTTMPVYQNAPNVTVGANASATSSTENSTSIQRAVVSASNAFLAALAAAPLNGSTNATAAALANATAPYVAPGTEFAIATLPGPAPLNFSDPMVINLAQQVRNNTAANGTAQSFVAYRQLSNVAVLLTSKLFGTALAYNVAYGAYFTQLWQYLPSVNATTNATAPTWQLTYGVVNVGPPGPAPNALVLS